MVRGKRVAGPVTKFRFLIRRGEQLPDNKTDAERLAERVRDWLRTGQLPFPASESATYTAAPRLAAVAGGSVEDAGDSEAVTTDPAAALTTIRAAVAQYQRKHIAKMSDTGATYIADRIAVDVGSRPLADLLDAGLIGDWLEDLAEEADAGNDGARAKSTINRYRARWSHLITFCRIEYQLTGPTPFYHPLLNPTSPLRRFNEKTLRRTRRLIAARKEEPRLLRACRQLPDGLMLGRVLCALDCGLRRREMLLVDIEHVSKDRNGWSIYVPAGNAKGRKERWVPIASARLLDWMKTRQQQLARTFGQARGARYVFGQPDGARLDSFRTEWEDVQIRGGFRAGAYQTVDGQRRWQWTQDDDLNWHDLRHECGSRLAQGTAKTAPVPLRDIQRLLGHSKLETTEIYLQTSQESVSRNVRRVQRALGL